MAKNKIYFYRIQKQMSGELLAEKIGVSTKTMYRYENGDTIPDIFTAMKIADALEITLDEIFPRLEDKKA